VCQSTFQVAACADTVPGDGELALTQATSSPSLQGPDSQTSIELWLSLDLVKTIRIVHRRRTGSPSPLYSLARSSAFAPVIIDLLDLDPDLCTDSQVLQPLLLLLNPVHLRVAGPVTPRDLDLDPIELPTLWTSLVSMSYTDGGSLAPINVKDWLSETVRPIELRHHLSTHPDGDGSETARDLVYEWAMCIVAEDLSVEASSLSSVAITVESESDKSVVDGVFEEEGINDRFRGKLKVEVVAVSATSRR
jgi:hypothetical protein